MEGSHERLLRGFDAACSRLQQAIGAASHEFVAGIDAWRRAASVTSAARLPGRDAPAIGPDRVLRQLMVRGETGAGSTDTAADSGSWLFVVHLAVDAAVGRLAGDPMWDLGLWSRAFQTHCREFGRQHRAPQDYAPDHLLWWKLRRGDEPAWTWLAFVARLKATAESRRAKTLADVVDADADEWANELLAWVLDVDKREREVEADEGLAVGELAGRLVYLPHRGSIGAWLHRVGLQQVRRARNRSRGIGMPTVALDAQGGIDGVQDRGDPRPGRTPEPLRAAESRSGPLSGRLESDWDACREAEAEGFVTGRELEALHLAATVSWDRSHHQGLNVGAFSWVLFGGGDHSDAGKRLQAVAARLFLWTQASRWDAAAQRRSIDAAHLDGWLSAGQRDDPNTGVAAYLSDRAARVGHLERGGATWGVHGRLQFGVFNLCAALTIGSAVTERDITFINHHPDLAAVLSRRQGLGIEDSPLLKGVSPLEAFGPPGPDKAVTRRSIWDLLALQEGIARLRGLVADALKILDDPLYAAAAARLVTLDPRDPTCIARLRDILRLEHQRAPGQLPSPAATYWLYDPNSNERDRLRSLVSAAHDGRLAPVALAGACTKPVERSGWSALDGTPLLHLLLRSEETL